MMPLMAIVPTGPPDFGAERVFLNKHAEQTFAVILSGAKDLK